MIVLVMFELSDKEVEEICKQDMHAEEILDSINDSAIYEDNRLEVYHLGDDDHLPVATLLGNYCAKTKNRQYEKEIAGKTSWDDIKDNNTPAMA
jgi:hypothetical protein